MAILLKTASVQVSSIQIIQVRVQNKGKSVGKVDMTETYQAPVTLVPPKPGMAMASHDAINTSVETTTKIPKTQRLTPDSVAPNPVNGRGHSKEIEMVHLIWTEYSIGLARFMAPP